MAEPEVVVVGGGIVGLFCAYHLRRRGRTVTVLERGEIGGPQSCSAYNSGFVGTQGAAPLAEPGVMAQGLRWMFSTHSPFAIRARPDPELARWLWHFRRVANPGDAGAAFDVLLDLKQRSLAMLRELSGAGPLAGSLTERGLIVAYATDAGFDKACRSVPYAVERGVPLRILEPYELHAIEPDVDFAVRGALLNEEGATLRTPEFVVDFGRRLRELGVDVRAETEVTALEVTGRQVTAVRTADAEYRPREVVIAAGAWSTRWARQLGLGLLLQPAKGLSVTVKTPQAAPRRPVLLGEGKVAIAPLGDRLRLAGTLELTGYDTSVSAKRVAGIMDTARAYLPGLELGEPVETWAGLRPCTPDSLPYLGRAKEYHNLSVAAGHGHIGLGLAPAGGELIAQLLTGERTDVDLTPFRLDRYQR